MIDRMSSQLRTTVLVTSSVVASPTSPSSSALSSALCQASRADGAVNESETVARVCAQASTVRVPASASSAARSRSRNSDIRPARSMSVLSTSSRGRVSWNRR